jgi:hypothetical protein
MFLKNKLSLYYECKVILGFLFWFFCNPHVELGVCVCIY